jgi:hypothetical protein
MKIPIVGSCSIGIWKEGYNDSEVRRYLMDKATDLTVLGGYHWRDAVVLEPDDIPQFLFAFLASFSGAKALNSGAHTEGTFGTRHQK